jgi:HD-like signal output (HDOD) protein/tRNA A-37 threonylcarbamoyl transferase component Bud32
VLRCLGQGGEGTVYLARDQLLHRLVAVKLLNAKPLDDTQWRDRLLEEARNVGKLQHPNIVTLFDVGEHQGAPFLVFEYVEGIDLATLRREEGPLPVERVVHLVRQVLAGMAHAHAHGVAHLDLKPSNIRVTRNDTARIMDFGTSRLLGVARSPAGAVMGTPRYLSPEHMSGGDLGPGTDVFALGLLVYEMLANRQALAGSSIQEIKTQVLGGRLSPPSRYRPDLDPRLEAVVLRALERDPLQRYPHAGAMEIALQEACTPAAPGPGSGRADEARVPALEFLLLRMRHKGDFPALSRTLGDINRLTADGTKTSAGQLANVILRDYALTERLLRLANSAFYGPRGRSVRNVSEAVTVLGFRQVRAAATGIVFGHHFGLGASPEARDAIVAAFTSGLTARALALLAHSPQVEEAFIAGLFHNLGRSLTLYYFPEEYAEIRRRRGELGLDWDAAANSVLEVSLHELGAAVARSWRFPEALVEAMRPLPEGPAPQPRSEEERLRYLACLANSACDTLEDGAPDALDDGLAQLAERFQGILPRQGPGLASIVRAAIAKVGEFGPVIGFDPGQSELARKVRGWESARTGAPEAPAPVPPVSPEAPADARVAEPTEPVRPAGLLAWLRAALGWRTDR